MPTSHEGFEYKHVLFKSIPDVQGGGCYADVFLPPASAGTGPWPIGIFYHGGGFAIGGAQHINVKHVEYLLERGFAVVSLEYRLAPHVRFDAIREDLLDGYKWVLEELPKLENVDSGRVFLFGSSAGGAATLIVTADAKAQELPLPRAIYPAYPLVKLSSPAGPGHMSYDEAIAAATPEQRAAFDKLLAEPVSATHDILAEDPNNPSPRAQWTHYIIMTGALLDKLGIAGDPSFDSTVDKDWPPAVVLSAGGDTLLAPERHAEALYRKLQDAGVESKLVVCEGMPHGAIEPMPGGVMHKWWAECKEALDFCIDKCK